MSTNPSNRLTRIAPLVAFLAVAAVYALRLGDLGFTEPDEARYAAIARDMLATRDFVTPRFNGFVYLDKPPLLHWLTAAAFALGGPSEFAGRLVSALAAAAGVALVYAWGRAAFGGPAGLCSAVILGSSLLWLLMGRVLRFDMLLSLAIAATLWWAWAAVEAGERGRRYWLLAAGAAGLGTLVKGPVALALPAIILLLYLVTVRRLGVLRSVPWLPCVAVLVVIVAPWCVLCERANPGALRYIVFQENLARAAGEVGESHARPWWYFLAILPAGLLPWALCLPGALIDAVGPRRRAQEPEGRASILCLLWVAVPVVLFSLPKGKLFGYILPALPAAALLIGRYLATPSRGRAALIATGGLLVGAGVALQTVGLGPIAKAGYPIDPFVPLIAAVLLLAGLAAIVFGQLGKRTLAVAGVMAGILLALHLGVRTAELASRPISERSLAEAVAARRQPGEKIVAYGRMSRGVLFYLETPIVVIGNLPGEYDFPGNGSHLRDWVYDRGEAERVLAASLPMIGTARTKDWQELRARLPARARLLTVVGKNVVFRTIPARH